MRASPLCFCVLAKIIECVTHVETLEISNIVWGCVGHQPTGDGRTCNLDQMVLRNLQSTHGPFTHSAVAVARTVKHLIIIANADGTALPSGSATTRTPYIATESLLVFYPSSTARNSFGYTVPDCQGLEAGIFLNLDRWSVPAVFNHALANMRTLRNLHLGLSLSNDGRRSQ